MKVLLTGGGTGGHITPLLTVAHELKDKLKDVHITYVGERNGKFAHLTDGHHAIDDVYTVFSGKFRRYHGQSWLISLLDIKTNLLNLRDGVFVLVGTFQAWRLLGKLKPDVIFLKGGFVGVPVGLAAAARKIPFMTHDSDAKGGLANRIVSRWAKIQATALSGDYYDYQNSKVVQVGVLVSPNYGPVNQTLQIEFKKKLNLKKDEQLLLITGGSLGASRLNKAVTTFIEEILNKYPKLRVVHQVGKDKTGEYEDLSHPRLEVLEFLNEMHVYTGAADAVITRGGANTLAELGVQGKACIVVPNPDLTGGHQLINTDILEKAEAVLAVREPELPGGLKNAVIRLLDDDNLRVKLGDNFRRITISDAASKVANLLIKLGQE